MAHDGVTAAETAERALLLGAAHASYGQQRWVDAFSQLKAADRLAPLDAVLTRRRRAA